MFNRTLPTLLIMKTAADAAQCERTLSLTSAIAIDLRGRPLAGGKLADLSLKANDALQLVANDWLGSTPFYHSLRSLFTITSFAFDGRNLFTARQADEISSTKVFLCSMPKSGSVWIKDKLEQALMTSDWKCFGGTWAEADGQCLSTPLLGRFAANASLAKSHLSATPYNIALLKAFAQQNPDTKVLLHLRDPRQALVSWMAFRKRIHGFLDVSLTTTFGDGDSFEHFVQSFYRPMISFIKQWYAAIEANALGPLLHVSTHEQLVREASQFNTDIAAHLNIAPHRLALHNKPKAGDKHFRAGKTDEWRSVFNAAQTAELTSMLPPAIWRYFGWTQDVG